MTKRINPLYFFSKKFATYKKCKTKNIYLQFIDIKALINIIMKYEKIKSNHNK
ncbi:hypothetical protein PFBG_00434 [Plasmodium falciparum 7G8]|uniref:Uncharacterized protein n=2 Tax=Plasmodium falciparum TaxID=5833 RepID=A0A024XF99_PLAFC|nr:hypothetical protein PFMC_00565 [Plasmodium falciparum CAMP/Malaysia]EUR80427.1 hypothetical protein PFBG_00434 [Plasmodium falciparum 7G8]